MSDQSENPFKDFAAIPENNRNNAKRKTVIDSDDDTPSQVGGSSSSARDEWLDSRNPLEISDSQRAKNIAKAKDARRKVKKNGQSKSAPKKKKPSASTDDFIGSDYESEGEASASSGSSEEEYDLDAEVSNEFIATSPLPRSAIAAMDSFLEDTPVEQNDKKMFTSKLQKKSDKLKKSGSNTAKQRTVDLSQADDESVEEVDFGDDDLISIDSDASGEGWTEEQHKTVVFTQATSILDQCDAISSNLRKSLKLWESGGDDDSKPNGDDTHDCINLIRISEKSLVSDSMVLSQKDVSTFCESLELKDYQLVGVNWIKLLHQNEVNGVLADDMGLGKTIQTIAFLAWLQSSKAKGTPKSPHLIVVPASTLSNWINEIARFCPDFEVHVYHGSQNERQAVRYAIKGSDTLDILLTTYTIFERESSKLDRQFMYSQNFEYLILDEAHCLKNAESSRYSNLSNIRSKRRLLLSGTPVQNDLAELLSLLSFLMPAIFTKQKNELLIEAFGWERNSKTGPSTATNAYGLSLTQLRNMLAPFVLRRIKRDVLNQLVDKVTVVEKVAMTNIQKKVYDSIIASFQLLKEKNRLVYQANKEQENLLDCKLGSGKAKAAAKKRGRPSSKTAGAEADSGAGTGDGDGDTMVVDLSLSTESLVNISDTEIQEYVRELSSSEAKHLFTALRKAANHPLLLRVKYNDKSVLDEIAQVSHGYGYFGSQCDLKRVRSELEKFSDFDLHQLCLHYSSALGKHILSREVLYDSPKFIALKDLLNRLISEGHRILLFSQWTRILDLLEVLMQDLDLGYLRLDGSTPVKDRQQLIDLYNHDDSIPVFLLSTKAGGLGINLTAADTVILHDLDFNPENDRQAEDRCHRIGQTRPVTVYKLVAKDTVDEDIWFMGERKRQLSDAVLTDHRSKLTASASKNDIDDDIGAIGWILQKALQKNTTKSAVLDLSACAD